MNSSQKLVLFAEKEPVNGILGLYKCIIKENPDRNIWFVDNVLMFLVRLCTYLRLIMANAKNIFYSVVSS